MRTYVLVMVVMLASLVASAQSGPVPTGDANDFTNTLPEGVVQNLNVSLRDYRALHHVHLVLSISEISEESARLKTCGLTDNVAQKIFEARGIGSKSQDDREGAVIAITIGPESMWIEHYATPALEAVLESPETKEGFNRAIKESLGHRDVQALTMASLSAVMEVVQKRTLRQTSQKAAFVNPFKP